ncbi:hypothetical protein MKEN_00429100 [Mycena kentingensis (nom. inval.)]|nr:hypothetical protein MKEN_00429100 [Mycena kentingensis (nom. inval.)]
MDAPLLSAAEAMLRDNRIDRSANVSALTLFLFDYCLTFPDEVRYFWGTRWSLVKFLFFVVRCRLWICSTLRLRRTDTSLSFSLSSLFSSTYSPGPNPQRASFDCVMWARFEIFTTLFCAFLVEVVMQIRLYAMYGNDKRVIFIVSMLCMGEIMSMVSLSLAKFDASLAGMAQVVNTDATFIVELPFCNNIIPDHFFPYWVAFMIFDGIILLFVVRKAHSHYHMLPDKTWRDVSQTLIGILTRDSVFYFVCNVAVFLGTTLLWRFGPTGLATIANSWSIVVPSTSAGRLMINMRKAYKPASDRISTAGLSGLGSLHIVCAASKNERSAQGSGTLNGTGSTSTRVEESLFDEDDY